jgi:crotonobetainyl-CoA:carnitine CoA-transferase CaiB-like acyl-CoA transferase
MASALPLAGIRVLEFGTFITGPYAARMLGDMGADVIKIERPPGGDPMRAWDDDNYSPYFQAYNKSKRSLILDLGSSQGVEACHRLVKTADVLLHNFRPGVAERVGIGAEVVRSLNPSLVYCQISGFGANGPYARRPSYNQVVQSLSGLDSLLIDSAQPSPVGPNFADTLTALFACYGILSALVKRERTGEGSLVEASMLASTLAFLSADVQDYLVNGTVPGPKSRPRFSQSYMVTTRDDRLLTIHLSSPTKFWTGLLRVIQRPDLAEDPRFVEWSDRVKNYDLLQAELAGEFRSRTRQEWLDRLEAEDVPAAPVLDLSEALDDPQTQLMGIVEQEASARLGVACPIDIDNEHIAGAAAPRIGEHSQEILTGLGYGPDDVERLSASARAK